MVLSPQQTSITVSWSEPAENGGRDDLFYQVEHSIPGNVNFFTDSEYVGGGSTSHTVMDLKPFTEYCIRVTAHNGVSDQDPGRTPLRQARACVRTKEQGIYDACIILLCILL